MVRLVVLVPQDSAMKRNARARYSVRLPVTPVSAQAHVEDRAGRTEDQLGRWRSVAARRRRAFELAQWVAAEQARRRRRRWMRGLRGVVTTMMVLAFSIGAVAVQSGPDAEARPPGIVMDEDGSPDLASGVVATEAPMVLAAVSSPMPSPLAEIEPVARLRTPRVAEPRKLVGPPVPGASEVVGVDRASITQWSDDDYRWVSFTVQTQQPTWMRWRDPSGAYPIEDMPCAFPTEEAHECRAGRSHWRLATALKEGARAGTWTIEACVGDVCQPVDTLDIGVR